MNARRRCLLFVVCLLPLVGCYLSPRPVGVKLRKRTQFESEWRAYLNLSPFKSLAVAGDLNGVYVSGFAHDSATQELADEEALRHCQQRRRDRRIDEPCRTYAVGDEEVAPR